MARSVVSFGVVWLLSALILPGQHQVNAQSTASAFALHDGDVVVFLGDEQTALSLRPGPDPRYPELVESFIAVRYPKVDLRFVNLGWPGDTVERLGLRMERDVFKFKPTVAVLCMGLNDAGFEPFEQASLDSFIKQYRQIIARLREADVKVFLVTPAAITDESGGKIRVSEGADRKTIDLKKIDYNETLAKYSDAVIRIAKEQSLPVVDWFAASKHDHEAHHEASSHQHHRNPAQDHDPRTPVFESQLAVAADLLEVWHAEPITVSIELDWDDTEAVVNSHAWAERKILVTKSGERRVLEIENLPLPWPMPGQSTHTLQADFDATRMCQFMFHMKNPPERGITAFQEISEQGATGQAPIFPEQLKQGFNLATADPLRSLEGVRRLFNLIHTKHRTQYSIWRQLELTQPEEAELAEAHQKLIDAWKAYVAGYERMIAGYPKQFTVKLSLAEARGQSSPASTEPAENK